MKPARTVRTAAMPDVIALVEESVHLLRRAPPGALAIYFAGAGAWTLGFLFFWSYASWFAPTGAQLAWGSLALVALYAWLKVAQAEFCARLLALRLGRPAPALSLRRLRRLGATQLRFHTWGLFAVPLASLLVLPFAATWSFFQNITVLGGADEDAAEPAARVAWAQAKLWPWQTHLALLILGVLGLVVWVNFAAAFYLVPELAHRLLGIDNFMARDGWSWFNTTFLALVTALAWLAIDPLLKAFHVLLLFHGRARRTGEDLRIELDALRPPTFRPGPASLALLAVALLALAQPTPTLAAGPSPAAVKVDALDRSIDRVLATRDFQWRLRPLPKVDAPEKHDPVGAFFRQGIEFCTDVARAIKRTFDRLSDWLDGLFHSKSASSEKEKSSVPHLALLRACLYGLIAAALILIGVVLWLVVKQGRLRRPALLVAARAPIVARPDLCDENIEAAQLPADDWLALAREQAALGRWRLALRALYLASLARLGAEGLVTLAKFKTNLDYERELRRRALLRTGLAPWFSARRRQFEDVWYGDAPAGEDQARAWLAELEKGALP